MSSNRPPLPAWSGRLPTLRLAAALTISLSGSAFGGCTGALDRGPPTSGMIDGDPRFAELYLRRLTQYEYARAVDDLLGVAHPETLMLYPRDSRTPFDNDASDQTPSAALVNGLELLATESVATLLADTTRRNEVVGCTPSGPADGACMRTFIRTFGRLAIRRPVPDDDVERYATAALRIAGEEGDFYVGAGIVMRAFLQHPRFVYRVEVGTPVEGEPDVVHLDGYEVASRLSFLLWGTPPDAELLDAAQRGELDEPESVRARALDMMEDGRAAEQAARIHAMWLGIEILPHSATLSAAMRDETATLIEEVLLREDRAWNDLFREPGTYVNDELATHYGMTPPGSTTARYVAYDDPDRRGVLSHGAFLSHGGSTGDRMPIHRGLAVRRRLLCESIELPAGFIPPALPAPTTGDCRADLLSAHRTGGCAGCHARMDPIGFGLESFDGAGVAQSFEPGRPSCATTGEGDIDGVPFVGPRGLSELLVDDGRMAECFESQLYRFALGRAELDAIDRRVLYTMRQTLTSDEFTYRDLISAIITSPAFLHRREPTP